MSILGVWIEVAEVAEDGGVETVFSAIGHSGQLSLARYDDSAIDNGLECLVDGFLCLRGT